VAADLDGDGAVDVAAACPNDNAVRVLFGHGDGTFAAPVDLPSTAPAAITAGDVDGDGRIDLAVVHGTANQVGVFGNTCAP
jgi:hypothetical protein